MVYATSICAKEKTNEERVANSLGELVDFEGC